MAIEKELLPFKINIEKYFAKCEVLYFAFFVTDFLLY